jgi:hypothetical protein
VIEKMMKISDYEQGRADERANVQAMIAEYQRGCIAASKKRPDHQAMHDNTSRVLSTLGEAIGQGLHEISPEDHA